MNRDSRLLELELRLLIARHGKTRVAEALSAIEDVDVAVLDEWIKDYRSKTKGKRTERRPSRNIEKMIQATNLDDLEARRLVERLAFAYQNREFLPELREVKRFLEWRGVAGAKLRSRADAFPKVVRVLADCKLDELQTLNEEKGRHESDLGVLTEQILGSVTQPRKSA